MLILPNKLAGSVHIQPSKSYLHRLIILSAISGSPCTVENINESDDILATLNGLFTLGLCEYKIQGTSVDITPGNGIVKGPVDCGESGSTLRFLIPLALTMNEEVSFIGRGRLLERPQDVYAALCEKHGFTFIHNADSIIVKGDLKPGTYAIEGSTSSQFFTGLCLALAYTGGSSTIEITDTLESLGYVDVTINTLSAFKVDVEMKNNTIRVNGRVTSPGKIVCPGDWSHAANFACLGAVNGGLSMSGLDTGSFQGDREIIDILISMGAQVLVNSEEIALLPATLSPTNIDGRDIPDIIPVLAVLMGALYGDCIISNIGRLRIKESDRIEATVDLINGIGGCATAGEDYISIYGVGEYTGGNVKTHNDHRIAMAAAVASVYSREPIQIDNDGCVNKSAPDFWNEFTSLGGSVKDEYYV